jgi:hypothetical protein
MNKEIFMNMPYSKYVHDLSEVELKRFVSLRAIEWANWPLFVSQPVIPIATIFLNWWWVIGGIYFVNILWSTIKYRSFSLPAAMAGVFFVRLRWITVGIAGLYFTVIQNYSLAFLAVLWPILSGLIVFPGKLIRIRHLIAESMGHTSELQMKAMLAEDEPFFTEEKILPQTPYRQKKKVMPFESLIHAIRSQI